MRNSSSTSSFEGEFGRFAARLAVFLLPALAALVLLEARLRRVPNSYSLKRDGMEQAEVEVEVLAVGSSHAYYAIDPAKLSRKAFNLANASQGLQADSGLVLRYLDRAPNLKLVILSFSYFSLGYRTSDSEESWRNGFTWMYFGVPGDQDRASLLHPRNYSLLALYGPGQVRGMARKGFASNLVENISPLGWYAAPPEPVALIEDEADGQKRVTKHESQQSEEARTENLSALRDLLGRLGQRGVKAAFVTLPVHRSYTTFIDRAAWKRSQEAVTAMLRPGGVTYLDLQDDPRFFAQDFHNHDHLNAEGAAKLSRILNDELIEPLLR